MPKYNLNDAYVYKDKLKKYTCKIYVWDVWQTTKNEIIEIFYEYMEEKSNEECRLFYKVTDNENKIKTRKNKLIKLYEPGTTPEAIEEDIKKAFEYIGYEYSN
jgi:hypothetical protein